MRSKKLIFYPLIILTIGLSTACGPVKEFMSWKPYEGKNEFAYEEPAHDKAKKTIAIVADTRGTEIFDLLAPFYLFNATEEANVYIVAEKKYPIILRKGLFLLPHYSFSDFDRAGIKPDVIVVPNLSEMNEEDLAPHIGWIEKSYSGETKLLSVCDGSLAAAATKAFDGKPITTHASDLKKIEKMYPDPVWVRNVSATHSGNTYSTAGVSNAVEGSLLVIRDVFGEETMSQVAQKVDYPYASPKIEHESREIDFGHKLTILNKVFFRQNRKVGVLLQEGINEFELAAILDTYTRTFPASIESFTPDGAPVTTRYGLTILPTGEDTGTYLDELHIIDPDACSAADKSKFSFGEEVHYHNRNKEYIYNYCFSRVNEQYGSRYENIVKLLLDYH